MKQMIANVVTIVLVIAGIVLGVLSGIHLTPLQMDTMKLLGIINLVSIAYCFIVGELTKNNSQMDKLWSILPIVYMWTITIKGSFDFRLIIMSVLVSLWGARLTYNFAKKGAYSIKFWEGEEDYRWEWLRNTKIFKGKRLRWSLFDLVFIAIYQNVLVLLICLPAVVCMISNKTFNVIDIITTILVLGFIMFETIADKQQMKFQTTKWNMIKSGKKLEELPESYNKGFNTEGLWSRSRHPNYFAEQAIWICLYLFTIGANSNINIHTLFNWSIVGSLMLVFLFIGSATLGEYISSSKYPEYKKYQKQVNRFIPFMKYKDR